MFLKKIKKTIQDFNLIRQGDRVLIAVSAGLDSISLLEVLFLLKKELEIELFVSHYIHNIRKDSIQDALFVYEICKRKNLPFICTSSPVPLYAKREKLSLEMAGRELRYKLWYELAKKYDFHRIALAHHLNDLVEEIFLKLIRGTGKRGLAGIPIKREDLIIRPFLFVTKEEIKTFALERNLIWREDSTNRDLKIPRNKIRHLLIPFLKENFNPKIEKTLFKTALLIGEEEELIESLAIENYQKISQLSEEDLLLKLYELKTMPHVLRRRIYFLAFKEIGIPLFRITSRHLYALENLVTGKGKGPVSLPGNYLAYRGPGYLRLTKKLFTVPYFEIVVSDEGIYQTPIGKIKISCISAKDKPFHDEKNFYLSADTLSPPFVIRKRKPGDKIYFPGIGHKKVKKFLQEKKIPSYLRDQLLIIEKENQVIGIWNIYTHPNFLVNIDTQKIWYFQLLNS